MGSFQPPREAFNLRKPPCWKRRLTPFWSTVVTDYPSQALNGELKTLISKKLCSLAASGVMDTEQLRSMTLTSLQLP